MCILSYDGIQVSDGTVVVLKVAVAKGRYLFNPFRRVDGEKCKGYNPTYDYFVVEKDSPFGLNKVVETPATFSDGNGYSCFLLSQVEDAKKYRDLLNIEGGDAVITRLLIPRGARYQVGVIGPKLKGSGLNACRAERLVAVCD